MSFGICWRKSLRGDMVWRFLQTGCHTYSANVSMDCRMVAHPAEVGLYICKGCESETCRSGEWCVRVIRDAEEN